jgi:peptide/nickel transport system permease protein
MVSKKYFLRRAVQTVFLFWLVLTLVFLFFRALPGDYTTLMVYRGASEEAIAAFEARWGLNEPVYVQYVDYIINYINLDVGTSIVGQKPVWDHVRIPLFNSIILIAPAITTGYILGSVLGTLFGVQRGTNFERRGLMSVIFFGSFPSFFLAIVMISIFASWAGIFPTGGMYAYSGAATDQAWWQGYLSTDFLWHYILPFATIVLRYLAGPTMIMRTNVVETSDQSFTFYHRITGKPRKDILKRVYHHSILPVITLFPISMTRALGGLVLVELVFNWPGIGSLLVSSVFARDYPVVQFLFFLIASFVITSNFLIDIIYGVVDPRVSVEGGAE